MAPWPVSAIRSIPERFSTIYCDCDSMGTGRTGNRRAVPVHRVFAVSLLIGYFFARQGFSMGRQASELLTSNTMQNVINVLSILGLFMMGILAANYVKVTSSLAFTISGKEFVIQDTLDTVFPGLLPILTVFGVYGYFVKKGMNVTKALIGLTVILGVLGAIGIL